ncbi:hypothetical protein [Bacteriovorax sp. Seq25_V]|uniref:hypothetical protein n=1 Tax=Bacteriovorax sp. Seq25_V TaxID=1201288 RepID=UPI00038A1DF3|nr:hypothetical protein [Bacteriovorax sp. Seq25_V]EQC47175.1 hypothetical protein M900_0846 [Bacteriovorax sp. Seq25_V]
MFRKKITLSFTITDFHLLFIAIAVLHISVSTAYIAISLPSPEVKKEVSKVTKIPVSVKSRISKKTRSSRFSRYIKGLKDYDINKEIIKENDDSLAGLTEQDGQILKDLTQDQINQILSEQEKQLSADIAKAKEIFQKNQKRYQACYEDALLKDKFLNGVSNILVSIDKGRVSNVETKFKGDGHKSALNILNDCLKAKSSGLNVSSIKGEHLINFNLIFKS